MTSISTTRIATTDGFVGSHPQNANHDAGRPRVSTSGSFSERSSSLAQKSTSGFASLLRSAGRKSSESLRSVRSSASLTAGSGSRRKSFGSSRKHLDQSLEPVPPLPPAKDSFSTSSFDLSDRNNPSRTERRRDNDAHTAAPMDRRFNGDEGNEDFLPPLRSEMDSFDRSASGAVSSSLRNKSQNSRKGLANFGSKIGLSQTQSYSGNDRDDDGAKTPTGRTTPTQADPYRRSAANDVSSRSTPTAPQGGDGNTVAQLYAVFGLPKDPSVWTLAEEDCVAGVHHMDGAVGRFWRPEVLGCSICPSPTEIFAKQQNGASGLPGPKGETNWEGRTADGKKGSSNPKFIEMADGRGRLERAETARVLSKALKLSFTREIEVVSGQNQYPPSATSHTFSFSVPTVSSSGEPLSRPAAASSSSDLRKGTGAVGVSHHRPSAATGEGYGLDTLRSGMVHNNGLTRSGSHTGFEESATPATFYGVVLTVWSAADERRAKAIKKELNRAAKQRGKDKKSSASAKAEEDESFLPANNAYFMPYAICIISRYPLYDLLGDWNKWAWHKYSRNIEMHNKLMSTILSKPAPRLGGTVNIESPDADVTFSCTFPGALEWGTGLIGVNFTMWPLFKTLSLDNILTICEIALAPNGRVLFLSRHQALLGLAVETVKYLVELRGWQGVANQNCHARDVKIYLEDPGTWIIAIPTELKSIVKPAPAVCIVDLDINYVNCPSPPPGAPSTKGLREKRKKKLIQALGFSSGDFRPPREFIEAYPGGRLRPLSSVQNRSSHSDFDQLEQPIWWDQTRVITAFDKTLHDGARPSALSKLLRMRAAKNKTTSEAELAAILALRKRASTFVDARDGLENKIGRLNKRLAFLMSESEMWKAQFSKIQQLVDRLTKEANDTRAKLDKERRESRRLSSTLAQRDMERVQLQIQLKEQEDARQAAQTELLTMQRAMDSLEQEREAMMDEIRNIISGAGGDDVAFNSSRFDLYNESVDQSFSRASSPTGSNASSSMTPSQAADRIVKARKAAEDRINEGRPSSRSRSRQDRPVASSLDHASSRSHRRGPSPPGSSAGGNHFPDDQMNYEIQKRTSSVTDQIARIQAQLENTLSHLEDRSRSHRSRRRRDSDVSYNSSHRYEQRTPSSLGGHGLASAEPDNNYSTVDDSELDYESSTTNTTSHAEGLTSARRERRRRREQRGGGGPPSAYKGPSGPSSAAAPASDSGNNAPAPIGSASSSGALQNGADHKPRASRTSSRELLQEREKGNDWATSKASETTPKVPGSGLRESNGVATESDDPQSRSITPVPGADTVAIKGVANGKHDHSKDLNSAKASSN